MILPGKELLYLRSSGTQYIDTGRSLSNDSGTDCRAITLTWERLG